MSTNDIPLVHMSSPSVCVCVCTAIGMYTPVPWHHLTRVIEEATSGRSSPIYISILAQDKY